MIIQSVDNKRIKYIKKLRNNKFIKEEKKFIVEGEHLVKEAYDSGFLLSVVKLNGYSFNYNVDEIEVTESVMKSISLMNCIPKVIGICKIKEDNEELGNKIIILDDVQDPGNVGTIIRSAAAFGFETVVLSNFSANKYNDKLIRATQGMIFKVNVITTDILDFISKIKNNGYLVYGSNVVFGIDVKDIKGKDKIAVVMGNEGTGVSEKVSNLVDKNLYIKMKNTCESLNVSVAASVIMYELGD